MLRLLNRELEKIEPGEIIVGIGRNLALDRDGDYEKTKLAYDAFVYSAGEAVTLNSSSVKE